MPLLIFVKYTYILAIVAVLIIELTKSGRLARYLARLAIVLAFCGSSTWVYAAYFAPRHDTGSFVRPAGHGSPPTNAEAEHEGMDLGGGDFDPENAGRTGGSAGTAHTKDGDGRDAQGPFGALVHKTAVAFGFAEDTPVADPCPHCPEMVRVTAGSSPIGAPATDAAATSAEMPQQVVRIWPGFSISRAAVSEDDFTAFLVATGQSKRRCTLPLAAVVDPIASDASRGTEPARCVSAADAEAYASWLTRSTGKRFRLPTAVEWEYAVRTSGPMSLKMGDVAEVVADCWLARLPSPLTAQSETSLCNRRMVKGATAIDEARWHRPSARRMLSAESAPLDVGFRLVQAD